MAFLAPELVKVGINRDNGFLLACAETIDFESWDSEKQLKLHLQTHRPEFVRVVNQIKPRLIIACGRASVRQVLNSPAKITKVRGVPQDNDEFGCVVLPVLSPAHVVRRPENKELFAADMATAGRLVSERFSITAAAPKASDKDYRWCLDLTPLLNNPPKLISVDCETTGLEWHKDTRILTVQISIEPGKSIMIPADPAYPFPCGGLDIAAKRALCRRLASQLKTLLENPKVEVAGQNFKFDYLFLKEKLGITVANYAHDTILMAHLLDENMRSKNLDDLARLYVPDMAGYNDVYNNDPDHQGKTRMDLFPPEKMLPYGCGDTDATFRLFNVLKKRLQADPKLWNAYLNVEMPTVRAFCKVERVGYPVDLDALERFRMQLVEHIGREEIRLLGMIPSSIKAEYAETGVGLKLTRPALLKAFLFTHDDGLKLAPRVFTKTKEPSTSIKLHLPYFTDDHVIIRDIIEFSKYQHMHDSSVVSFQKYITNGKIFPSYKLHGTTTFRPSSENPNGQNMPKHGPLAASYRKIFKAPPGYVFVDADYSQIELRIMAILSGDATMLRIYREGGDIHRKTGASVRFKRAKDAMEQFALLDKKEQKFWRQAAKAVNFGFLFGMWYKKFGEYAKTTYNVDFTENESKDARIFFFLDYPGIEKYHGYIKEWVNAHGYVRYISGHVRHLPDIRSPDAGVRQECERQAINSPVQGFAVQLGKLAIARITNDVDPGLLKICGFVHDSIVALAPEDRAMEAGRVMKRYMETNPLEQLFGFKPPIPIIADVSIGRSLADLIELEDIINNETLQSFADLETHLAPPSEPPKITVLPPKKRLLRLSPTRIRP